MLNLRPPPRCTAGAFVARGHACAVLLCHRYTITLYTRDQSHATDQHKHVGRSALAGIPRSHLHELIRARLRVADALTVFLDASSQACLCAPASAFSTTGSEDVAENKFRRDPALWIARNRCGEAWNGRPAADGEIDVKQMGRGLLALRLAKHWRPVGRVCWPCDGVPDSPAGAGHSTPVKAREPM